MQQIDVPALTTLIGIVTLAVYIVTELVTLVEELKPFKRQVAILVTILIGIGVKIFGLGFETMHWYEFVLSLVFAAGSAQVFNDKVANPVLLGLRLKKRHSANARE